MQADRGKGRDRGWAARGWLALALALALVLGAPGAPAAERLTAVASFSVLADLVGQVGGGRLDLATLVGPNQDPHVYRPTPSDARKLARAAVVFVNGAGFEGWLARLVSASGFAGVLVTATDGLTLRPLGRGDARDPHAWQDPRLALGYVDNIERGLARADPEGGAYYATNAASYRSRIRATYTELRAVMEGVAAKERRIVAPHDGFAYLGAAFGIEIFPAGPIASEGEASAARLAALVRMIDRLEVRAVFTEPLADPRLMAQVARESGARFGGTLYSDALSPPHGPAPTYLALLEHNVRAIAAALAPASGSSR